jgi:hypothetical protein
MGNDARVCLIGGFVCASLGVACGRSTSRTDSTGGLPVAPSEAVATLSEKLTTDSGTDSGAFDAGSGVTSTNLQLQVSENACAVNLAQDYFEVTNGSTGPVNLSNVTIKYWINDTSGVQVTPEVWYGGCVTTPNDTCVHSVQGVTATATQFSPACGPDPNHQANWEITISTTDTTPLAVGQTWSNLQTAVNLSNYANFVPGTGTWFSGCGSGLPYASNPAFAVYDQGNLVATQGITVPSCRTPEFLQIQNYIDQTFYSSSDIQYSFVTGGTKQVDCIDFSAQHSVKAWLAQGVTIPPAPPTPVTPASMAQPNVAPNLAFAGQPDINGNAEQCPAGTVPTMRPTVAQIEAVGGLTAYLQALANLPRMNSQDPTEHDCWLNNLPGNGTATTPATGANLVDWEHTVGIQNSGWAGGAPGYFGMQVITPIYSPFVQAVGDHTDTQLWAQTGTCESWFGNDPCTADASCTPSNSPNCAVQSLEVAVLTENSGPTLAVFFTADGYNSFCFAGQSGSCISCPTVPMPTAPSTPDSGTSVPPVDAGPPGTTQFQGTDCWVAWPGAAYSVNVPLPVKTSPTTGSQYGVPPYEMQFIVWNGAGTPSTGWWVYVNGSLIGWYPPDTFNWPDKTPGPMANGPATYLQAGGEVENTWPNNFHTDTAMVSDNNASTGYTSAAYTRNVGYFDAQKVFHDATLFYNTDPPSNEGDDGIPGLCGEESAQWNDAQGNLGGYTILPSLNPSAPPAGQLGWGQYLYFGGGKQSCTTAALQTSAAPLAFTGQFVVDTGLAPYNAIGASYGGPGCLSQLVVDVSGSVLASDFSVFGGWSESVSSAANCSELNAQAIVYGRPSGAQQFQIWDEVATSGSIQGTLCNPVQGHTNSADMGAAGTLIPKGTFAELRIAVGATQNGALVPVLITGTTVP